MRSRRCFVYVTASNGAPNAEPASGLHLAEHHGPAARHHEVELAFATAPVAVEQRVARVRVPGRDRVLTGHPERTAVVGHGQISLASSSMFTSLKVTTRTLATKRAGRYMSHTQASLSSSSK